MEKIQKMEVNCTKWRNIENFLGNVGKNGENYQN